jgi:hypothetical protein
MRGRTGILLLLAAGTVAGPLRVHAGLEIEQSVNSEVLTAGAVLEFVVAVHNAGAEAVDSRDVRVFLSSGLAMPAGTAPFFSQGSFDAAASRWVIGELRSGASATLSIPAQVTADPLPPCVFSRATLLPTEDEPLQASDRAFATLRRPEVTSCVDLALEPPTLSRGFCGSAVTLRLRVLNLGPDPAHQVRVSVTQEPDILPGLAFDSPCPDTLECVLNALGPSTYTFLQLRSAEFENAHTVEVLVAASVQSDGTELKTGNELASESFTLSPFTPCDFSVDPGQGDFGLPAGPVGCFIATAAYGSPMHPRVAVLRHFRDRFLATHAPGRALVAAYYRASPTIAAWIAERPASRAVVRAFLAPLVLAVEYPLRVFGALVIGPLLWCGRRRVRCTARRS